MSPDHLCYKGDLYRVPRYFKMRPGHARKVNHMIIGLKLYAMWYQSDIVIGGDQRLSSITWLRIQWCLCNETPVKTLAIKVWIKFQADNTQWTQKFHLQDPPGSHSMHLPFSWFWCVFFCYNKSVVLSIAFSKVLWVFLASYQTQESSGNSWICSQLARSVGGLGIP